MYVLTPAERRAVVLIVGLLAAGALADLREARREPEPRPSPRVPERAMAAADSSVADTGRAAVPSAPEPSRPRVDLNRATLEDLDALPGVGPVLAGRILEHRALHGPFRDTRDLRAVRGIGPRLFERLRPLVTAENPERRP